MLAINVARGKQCHKFSLKEDMLNSSRPQISGSMMEFDYPLNLPSGLDAGLNAKLTVIAVIDDI